MISRSTVIWTLALMALMTTLSDARSLTIAALGDSTTAGTPYFRSPVEAPPNGAGNPEGFYGYWVYKKHPEWNVVNLGVNGQRSDEIRDRLNAALDLNPRYIIILAGVNDIYAGIDLDTIGRNLAGMYKEAKRRNVIPIAATVLPFDRASPKQAQQIRSLNDWIHRTADTLRIPELDFNRLVADSSNPDKLNGSDDGFHPDIGAYRQMGLAVVTTLEHLEKNRPQELAH
jgi:lysophospholipase L1-like esterase